MTVDKKALRILFDTHWSPGGWKSGFNFVVSDDDFQYAKQAGLMFDAVSLTHRRLVSEILQFRNTVHRGAVSKAFLASLSTRRLDLRSALASYAVALNFPKHAMDKSGSFGMYLGGSICAMCGAYVLGGKVNVELNALNFERFKWGGVRRLEPTYVWFDLREFAATDHLLPTAEDHQILTNIVNTASQMKADATPNDLADAIAGLLPSNKSERRVLIEILGTCGILQPSGRSGFWKAFEIPGNRDRPGHSKNDWNYPVIWWRGADRVNREALNWYFEVI